MEQKKTQKTVWEVLSAVDCSQYVEKKDKLTYLSWAWAWGLTRKFYPTASYTVREWLYPDGMTLPYLHDPALGYLVETAVTIEGETISMRLPVMDSKNKAMKAEPYKYCVTYGGRTYEKSVDAATMFDINTAIMRCLTKNLAMFGLGHYIYAGEDLPKPDEAVDPSGGQPHMDGVNSARKREAVTNFIAGNDGALKYYSMQYNFISLDDLTEAQVESIYGELKANRRI